MKILQVILSFVLLMFHMVLYSQNYIPNASFEDISDCPDDFFQIYKSPPWFSPNCEPFRPDRHGFAILFTGKDSCNNDLTGVPKNVWSYQGAHSGTSYGAVEIISAAKFIPEYRQYLETKLQQPLQAGKKYLFSMFYNLSYYAPVSADIICFKNDSLGAYFSETIVEKNHNCEILPVKPQVYGDGKKISPSAAWIELSGCITAKGNEEYVTIGNFANNISSNCSIVDSIGYYLFIDDVTVIAETTKQFDTVLCSVNDWKINAQQFRQEYATLGGWKYQWNDGSTDMERKFTAPGNYTLKVINKDCFTDEYNFKINFVDCFCKEYIPNAFTPNGDNVNDKFIPHINCQTQQVSEYRFSIFNRWGTRVFFTSSRTEAWDGTYMGQPAATGVYVYLVEYKAGESQKVKTVKGTVLALR